MKYEMVSYFIKKQIFGCSSHKNQKYFKYMYLTSFFFLLIIKSNFMDNSKILSISPFPEGIDPYSKLLNSQISNTKILQDFRKLIDS